MSKKRLEIESHVNENLKKVTDSDGTETSLSISNSETKVSGKLTADTYVGPVNVEGGRIESSSHIELHSTQDIILNSGGNDIIFRVGAFDFLTASGSGYIKFFSPWDALNDFFQIYIGTHGNTILSTGQDGSSNSAHLTLEPDGDARLWPDSGKVSLKATNKLYFDEELSKIVILLYILTI